jgi:hypothetical protein
MILSRNLSICKRISSCGRFWICLSLIKEMKEYYQLLGLPIDATAADLKKAFREKAKLFHPDINPSPLAQESFIRIHTAYEMILSHLERKTHRTVYNTEEEKQKRRQQAAERAERYSQMKYEEFLKECEAYRQSPYKWVFQALYYGLFYLYMFCAMVFAFVPLGAGWEGGILYFLLCSPLFVLAYYTVIMANNWKKEIDPLFSNN